MKPLIGWKPVANDTRLASARLRCFLPVKYLREAGWRCELFDRGNAGQYRLVVFQKTYDEESQALAERLKAAGARVVFDLCDNHFYNPGNDPSLAERAGRLRHMIDLVDAVTVSTVELQKLMPGKEAVVIDDAVEWPREGLALSLYVRLSHRARGAGRPLRVVWYGNAGQENPPFGLVDLPRVLPALERLNATLPVTLTVISNSRAVADKYTSGVSFPVKYYDWKPLTFAFLFRQQDVCVIPVTMSPFTACKTSNRLVLSLLHGVPAIADRIPSYEEFGSFVLFADWQNNLFAYATDAELRQRHVGMGVAYIRSEYGKERVVRQWSSLFRELLG